MSNWQSGQLGDFITLQRGFDLPRQNRRSGRVPVVSSSGVSDYVAESRVRAPGVVTGRYGTIGHVFYLTQDFWPLNTTLYVKDFKGNDPRFVSYFLRTVDFSSCSDKSSVPGVNRNDLHTLLVSFPPLAEQREIARILGALDDKIELNRRMSATLEAMARALFKCWFVDFEPVRLKQQAREHPDTLPPALRDAVRRGGPDAALTAPVRDGGLGLDPAIAALFPNSFEDSPLGDIPKGWRVGKLSDVASEVRRQTSPGSLSANTPYIGLEHMPRRSVQLSEWGHAGDVTSGKSWFRRGQILFGKLRPYFHKVGIAPVDGVCSTDIIVISPRSPDWFGYALGHLTSDEFIAYTDRSSTGTKMPRTSWRTMAAHEIVLPDSQLASAFTAQCVPHVELLIGNVQQARILDTIRDVLLPRLVAGQLPANGEIV